VSGREAARSREWAQHFSNASCLINLFSDCCLINYVAVSYRPELLTIDNQHHFAIAAEHIRIVLLARSANLPTGYIYFIFRIFFILKVS